MMTVMMVMVVMMRLLPHDYDGEDGRNCVCGGCGTDDGDDYDNGIAGAMTMLSHDNDCGGGGRDVVPR